MRGSASRILLKLSGEAFKGPEGALSDSAFGRITQEVASVDNAQLAIVVGGGNILRGARTDAYPRVEADSLGMLATILNALAFRLKLEVAGRVALVQSAIHTELTEDIDIRTAMRALEADSIVIFAGGTGSPLVSTDTAAAIRAVSIGADLIAKASTVNGVYDGDPATDPNAQRLSDVSYDEFLQQRYGVMDFSAVEICRTHGVPIEVFDFSQPGALQALASGERVGTRIS